MSSRNGAEKYFFGEITTTFSFQSYEEESFIKHYMQENYVDGKVVFLLPCGKEIEAGIQDVLNLSVQNLEE